MLSNVAEVLHQMTVGEGLFKSDLTLQQRLGPPIPVPVRQLQLAPRPGPAQAASGPSGRDGFRSGSLSRRSPGMGEDPEPVDLNLEHPAGVVKRPGTLAD